MSEAPVVSAAEFTRNFGYWQQQALLNPVTVTHHGRARVMLVSTDYMGAIASTASSSLDKRAEQVAAGKLTAITENMAEGFVSFDANLKLREINKVAEAYYGMSREEVTGTDLGGRDSVPVDEFVIDSFRRVMRTGELLGFDMLSRHLPERRISLRIFPYMDGVAGLFVNVSEQERLRSAADNWTACSAALDRSGEMGWIQIDERARITTIGAVFESVTGFSQDTIRSVRLFDIVAPEDRKRLQNLFEELMQSRQMAAMTCRIVVRNGHERVVHLSLAPLVRDYAAYGAIVVFGPGRPNERPIARELVEEVT